MALLATLSYWTLLSLALLFAGAHTCYFLASSLKTPALSYYPRVLSSFVAIALCAIYGTFASAFLNLFGYGGLGQYTTARAFKWTMWFWTGVWFKIEDTGIGKEGYGEKGYLEGVRPAVFVGNHQSELDVLFCGHVFPPYCSVTAKASLRFVPFLGWFMLLSKTVFIERSSRTKAVAAFDKAAQQMHKHQQSVYIFPEGTRSYYDKPDLLPFKKGAFHLAVQAQVPIVPVVVANYSNVLDVRRKIYRAGTIPAKVLKPIETKGKTKEDVDALVEQARNTMLAELKNITVQARHEGVASREHETKGFNGTAKSSGVEIGIAGSEQPR